jgi:hypothetical protein
MERLPTLHKSKKIRKLAALACFTAAIVSACKSQEQSDPVPQNPIPIETTISPTTNPGGLSGVATANAPAARVGNATPESPTDPEAIRQQLRDMSVVLLQCSGVKIGDIGVVTAAHCFKNLENGMIPGDGTSVYANSEQGSGYINTVTDLIVNYEADNAYGAFPGHTAQEVFEEYTKTLPATDSERADMLGGTTFVAGSPGQDSLRLLELDPLAYRNVSIFYDINDRSKDRIVPLLTTVDNQDQVGDCGKNNLKSCLGGISGSPSITIGASGASYMSGIFISSRYVDTSVEGTTLLASYPSLEVGDTLCGFNLTVDPANNQSVSYSG